MAAATNMLSTHAAMIGMISQLRQVFVHVGTNEEIHWKDLILRPGAMTHIAYMKSGTKMRHSIWVDDGASHLESNYARKVFFLESLASLMKSFPGLAIVRSQRDADHFARQKATLSLLAWRAIYPHVECIKLSIRQPGLLSITFVPVACPEKKQLGWAGCQSGVNFI